MKVPKSLKTWFLVHFIIDYIIAIPLFFFPVYSLTLLGLETIDPVTARLVAAALFAVGGISLLAKEKSKETYNTLLTLNLIWSGTAILGLLLSIFQGYPKILWVFVVIFGIFFEIWYYYKKKLGL